jgi:Sec-independent protein translocase protein TatA
MGTELLIGLVLAFLVLGPERMHAVLGHLGRAKAQFDKFNLSQVLSPTYQGALTEKMRSLPRASNTHSNNLPL